MKFWKARMSTWVICSLLQICNFGHLIFIIYAVGYSLCRLEHILYIQHIWITVLYVLVFHPCYLHFVFYSITVPIKEVEFLQSNKWNQSNTCNHENNVPSWLSPQCFVATHALGHMMYSCGGNQEGTLFSWLYIYYVHLASVIFKDSVCLYIYIYIYSLWFCLRNSSC